MLQMLCSHEGYRWGSLISAMGGTRGRASVAMSSARSAAADDALCAASSGAAPAGSRGGGAEPPAPVPDSGACTVGEWAHSSDEELSCPHARSERRVAGGAFCAAGAPPAAGSARGPPSSDEEPPWPLALVERAHSSMLLRRVPTQPR